MKTSQKTLEVFVSLIHRVKLILDSISSEVKNNGNFIAGSRKLKEKLYRNLEELHDATLDLLITLEENEKQKFY